MMMFFFFASLNIYFTAQLVLQSQIYFRFWVNQKKLYIVILKKFFCSDLVFCHVLYCSVTRKRLTIFSNFSISPVTTSPLSRRPSYLIGMRFTA